MKQAFQTFAQLVKKAAKKKPTLVKIAYLVCRQDTQIRTKSSGTQVNTYRDVYRGDPLTDKNGKPILDKKTGAFTFEPKADRMPPIMIAPAADWTTDDPDSDTAPRFYVIDGDHRATGAARAGLDEIPAVIVDPMTLDAARFAAVGANADHGLARSNADKQAALKVACELSDGLAARCKKSPKTGRWGKVSYTGTLPNGETVTARNLAKIAGVSHEAAAQYLKATYAAEFQNTDQDQDDDDDDTSETQGTSEGTPTGNAADDEEPRDLTAMKPREFAKSIIAQAKHDPEWLREVAMIFDAWLENNAADEAA